MAYTSLNFMLFLAVVILLYYAVPKKIQWAILLIASYAFYLFSGVKQVVFIMATTLITYAAGRLMQKKRDAFKRDLEENGAELSRDEKREMKKVVGAKIHRIQVFAVLLCLGILAVVKYVNFATENINELFSLFHYDYQLPLINIIVPLGISFYTFQSIGYLIDIGRGKYEAEKHLGKYALFVSFFPSIVQGPINRFDDLGKQLKAEHKLDYCNLKFGAQLMLWGFFKKLVIADRVAPMVDAIFSDGYKEYSGIVFVVGMLAYAVQIYCDFSGGIDIARGAAQMLGINLPQNFERPYFSETVAEYWRRWHITLGAWMRDYVFYPVMLSKPVSKLATDMRKKGKPYLAKMAPSVITPFVVFFLIGIWHGASWQYIAFGLYNATIVAGSVALEPVFEKMVEKLRINTGAFSWRLFRIVRTFIILGVSKLLVCAPGLRAALYMLKHIFTDIPDLDFLFGVKGEIFTLGVDQKNMTILLLGVLILLIVSILQECGIKMRETIAQQNLYFRWFLYLAAIVVILFFGIYGPGYDAAQFIYQAY